MIYIRGVKSEDLVAIVDFLYYGEANVYQENLDSFLALANELEVKGLMGEESKTKPENTETPPSNKVTQKFEELGNRIDDNKLSQGLNTMNENLDTTYNTKEDKTMALFTDILNEHHDLDEQIRSMMGLSESGTNGRNKVCTVCGKEGQQLPLSSTLNPTTSLESPTPVNSVERCPSQEVVSGHTKQLTISRSCKR